VHFSVAMHRVVRGASWLDCMPDYLLSSSRVSAIPRPQTSSIGFRVVLAGGISSSVEG
jgi:formylglycine-generating enzyme required for sulfatase activity